MIESEGQHEATRQFREHLEWEIRREINAGGRLAASRDRRRRLRTVALLILGIITGVAGSVVSAQVADSRARDRLLAAEEAAVEISLRRVEIARAMLADARKRFDLGVITRESLVVAEAEYAAMTTALDAARSRAAEVRTTSAAPRDDLTAPRVGDRDFVAERLTLELATAQRRLSSAEASAADLEQRRRLGMIDELPLFEVRAELASATAELEILAGKLELRQAFLRGSVPTDEVVRRTQVLELGRLLRPAEERLKGAEARIQRIRQMRDAGQVQEVDLMQAELDLRARQIELELLRRNLESIAPR